MTASLRSSFLSTRCAVPIQHKKRLVPRFHHYRYDFGSCMIRKGLASKTVNTTVLRQLFQFTVLLPFMETNWRMCSLREEVSFLYPHDGQTVSVEIALDTAKPTAEIDRGVSLVSKQLTFPLVRGFLRRFCTSDSWSRRFFSSSAASHPDQSILSINTAA